MKNWGVSARVLFVAMVPAALMALLLTAYFVSSRFSELDESLVQQARAIARQMAVASDYGVFAGNREALQVITDAALRQDNVRGVTIVDADGYTLAHSGAADAAPPPSMRPTPDLFQDSERVIVSQYVVRQRVALEDFFDAGEKPSSGGKVAPHSAPRVVGRVVVELSSRSLQLHKRGLLTAAMVILVAVLMIGAVLARRMSRSVTTPLHEIVTAAERIGAGELAARVQATAGGSLRILARGVNRMAQRLEAARDELESRIQAATQELKEKKEEAERANLAKSRFLAAASHDLRQPIHALGLFVADLAQQDLSPPARSAVHHIQASADAVSKLLDSLLDISRLDAGVVMPRVAGFPLEPLFSRLERDFGKLATDKGIRLRAVPTGCWVRSDPVLLERILLNLVSNAVRYTARGGVLIGARRRGRRVVVEVRDSGPGIPEGEQAAVFQEFVQLGNPERSRAKGLGLGLAIVQRLSQLLGHPLILRSAPGYGSTFAVELDEVPAGAQDRPDAPPQWLRESLEGLSVVVIDDDPLVSASMQGLLQSWRCSVVVGESGADALWALEQSGTVPDAVLCDLRLAEGQSGLDVLDAMRQRYGNDLACALISGDTAPEVLHAARARGYLLLHKPLQPAKLRALLQTIVTERG
ncbi:MAG: response regulator [Betaproteobacteria bacterium]|nr:response regulator [Betaproteobacteria bacterium]